MDHDSQGVVIGREGEAVWILSAPAEGRPVGAFRVRVLAGGIDASTTANFEAMKSGPERLASYFGEIAEAWRGWPGNKELSDDFGSLILSAQHDSRSQLLLSVRLTTAYRWPGGWDTVVEVRIEPGALDRIAKQVATLVASRDIR